MLSKLFILFLLIHLPDLSNCIECFDFQCFDGGYKSKSNCFKCKNVSLDFQQQWLQHLKQMTYMGKQLKEYDLLMKYELKIKQGMYCCSINESYKHKTCSLSFASGSKDGLPHFGMGCTQPDFWYSSICNNRDMGSRCCRKNHCNSPNNTEIEYMMNIARATYPLLQDLNAKDKFNYLFIICLCTIFMCLILLGILYVFRRYTIKNKKSASIPSQSQKKSYLQKFHWLRNFFTIFPTSNIRRKSRETGDMTSFSDSMMEYKNSFENLQCSGSGAGKPLMTKRTAATDITLICIVGDGRFGTVWLGKWNGDNVAVKIFSTREERSWNREKQMYQKNFLRHSNVLGYVATDSRDNGLSTELWLVTDYHENGSLYDYLRSHVLTVEQAVKMIRSITNGLAYLHTEINGTELRPGIAHRDLKSRNILVKSCGECCIGDLGLAVRLNEDYSALDTNRVGTRRYMAPEIILDKLVLTDLHYNGGLEAFKKADIYSYSLILWEILRCCQCLSIGIFSSPYEMPYQTLISNDPTIEEMRIVVCERKIRPPVNPCWDNLNPIKEISKSIQESWFEEPGSRLTVLRLKKIMANVWTEVMTMKSTIADISMEHDCGGNMIVSRNDSVYRSPFANMSNTSTDLPSSVTSNDIPNIVIKNTDSILITDSYCPSAD